MEHKALTELRTMLTAASKDVSVGAEYYHYKDKSKTYMVTGLCILEASDEVAVKYAMADNLDIEFVRALKLWLEMVVWEGQMVPRFVKAG